MNKFDELIAAIKAGDTAKVQELMDEASPAPSAPAVDPEAWRDVVTAVLLELIANAPAWDNNERAAVRDRLIGAV